MNRFLLLTGVTVGACAIAVPAAAGLSGNPSFSQHVPVRVPAPATIVSVDDHGGLRTSPRTTGTAGPTSTATPTSTAIPTSTATPTTARNRPTEPGDDRGTHTGTATHTEPGDDRGTHTSTHTGTHTGTATHTEPGDDNHRNRGGSTVPTAGSRGHGSHDTTTGHGGGHGTDD